MSGLSGAFVNTRIPRDGMSRPLIKPQTPDPKKPDKRTAYRRVTRFISIFEDRYNLELHGQREVIFGMGGRPDLIALAGTIPSTWNDGGYDKMSIAGKNDSIATQARDAAKEKMKSNLGTALHSFCEQLDKGQLDWRRVPDQHKADLHAYHAVTRSAGMNMVAIETFRVHDAWKVAGTADRIVEINGRFYIADIKTGKIEFDGAVMKMAMQLAMYAHSLPYDIGADQRSQDPFRIDMTRGLIIHLPPGSGVCELHWLDLQYGWRACQEAKRCWEVRDAGKKDKIMSPFYGPVPEDRVVIPTEEAYMLLAINAKSVDELEYLWRSARFFARASESFVSACAQRKTQLLIAASA